MKKTSIKVFGAIMATALSVVSIHAAGTDTWQGNQANANWGTALNWDTAAVPANGDSLVFGAQGSSGLTLNNNISGLAVNNFDINGPDAFTFSGNGLKLNGTLTDAASVNETFSLGGITIGSAVGAAIKNTGSGILALGALSQTGGSGGTVKFTTTGSISTTTTDNNGMIGGWAAIDNGNSTYSWAHSGASGVNNITAATTSTLGTSFSGNHSTANWLNSDGNTTLTAATTVNSFISASDVTISGLLTIGSGGVIFGNNGSKWIKNGTSGQIASGLASGELFVYTPNTGSWDMELQVPIVNNGSTPGILVKDGSGLLHLIPNATYSGGTVINNGALFVQGSGGHITGSELGTGTVTISGGTLDFSDSGSANVINYAQSFVLNGGTISSEDGMPHLATGAGATITVNGPTTLQRLWGHVTQKYLALDGILQGSGTLTLQNESTPYDGSSIWINNAGNTFSGTVTVNANTYNGSAMVMGANSALQYATVNLQGTPNGNDTTTGTAKVLYGVNFKSGVTAPVLGALTGTGNFWLQDLSSNSVALTVGGNNSSQTFSGVLSGSGSLAKSGTGTLTLSGANTYTGNTTISGGTLALTGGFLNSSNITVGRGATLDVSALGSVTLGGSQALYGGGTNGGSINTSSGTKIYAGTDGGYGTNVFNNDLTLASGALTYMDVGTTVGGSNDLITVAGTLTLNNNILHLKAPSTSANLAAADYTLFTSPNTISGSFAGITWDVQPANAGHYSIVTGNNTVTLHYTASTAPAAIGSASPAPAVRNQTVLVTVTATNGNSGTVNGVTVDVSPVGGSSLTLVEASSSGSVSVWTNTVTVTPDTLAGGKTLVATVTAPSSPSATVNIPLTVVVGNDVWNGASLTDDYFSTALNWTNKLAPGYVGDSLEFAGSARLTPDMNHDYTVTSVTFDSGAVSRTIGSTTASTLMLSGSGSLVNNSANPQTLNVPLADFGGGLTKTGNGLLTLAAVNLYGGQTVVNAGTLSVSGSVSGADMTVAGQTGNAALSVSGSLGGGTNNMVVGAVTNAVGALWQTGGTISLGTGTAFFGHLPGGYGYGRIDSGTLNLAELQLGTWGSSGGNGGNALFEVNGGTVTDSGWLPMARGGAAQTGVLNIFSGSLSFAGGGLVCNWGSGQTSIINIMGGSLATTANNEIGFLNGTGIVNLLGGVATVSAINGAWGSPRGQVSFNGGTLQASGNNGNFLAVTTANIYGGGATIDNNGNAITNAQPLLAPAGNGIHSASVTSGGAGYIAPPIITITNATGDTTGIGATAIAQINPLTGVVTNVIVTCPGVNYTATPVFVVSGGGATTPAVITGATPTASTSGGLTSIGLGTLTLSGANTYTGNTTISNGTLALATGGSISSTNIIVTSGAYFDVSALASYTLNSGQNLEGSGQVNVAQNGLVAAASGSGIYPGTDGTIGSLTINGGLTLSSGATANFDLDTTYNGANDQIAVSGTLTLNGNAIHIKAPSSLDNSGNDYVLITASSISGSFSSTPVWDVRPANAANFTVLTSGSQVTLHYSSFTAPTGSGFATPSPAVHNQNVLITVTVTNGSGTVDPNTGVVLNAGTLDGSLSSVPLVLSRTISSTVHVFTNTITVPTSPVLGSYTLTATITDSNGQIGTANIALTVVPANNVWNGLATDDNWSSILNWTNQTAPNIAGDNVVFAGTVRLTPNMENNYSVGGLTFDTSAGSFVIASATASSLTLNGGVTNNSTHAQVLNVPVVLGGAATLAAGSAGLVLEQPVSGSGALTTAGSGTTTLLGVNTYTGNTTIAGGSLLIGGQLNSGTYAGIITNAGTLNYNSSSNQVLSGDISGTGGITVNATNGGVLTLGSGATSPMTYTGPTIVDGGELQLNFANAGNSYGIAASSGLIINNGASVVLMNDNSLAGANSAVGSVPVTINAGGVLTGSATVDGGAGASAHIRGLLTLKGGTLANGGTGAQPQWGTWNLDDVVVVNGGTNTSTMSALDMIPTQAGGTIFSVTNGGTASGVDLNVTGTLINGTGLPDTGIILNGNGTMVLSGANTYAGTTTVSNGTLIVNGSLAAGAVTVNGGAFGGTGTANGAVTVNAGGKLTPGTAAVGTLTVNNNLTLAGNVLIKLNKNLSPAPSNDVVNVSGTLAYGGTLTVTNIGSALVAGDNFRVFKAGGTGSVSVSGNAGSGLAFSFADGVVSVASTGPSGPGTITNSISGNSLNLTWPAGQGWRLEAQTNNLSAGLSATGWGTVSGTTDGSYSVTIDPAKPTVFYRLVNP